jgi:hypothetical protein
MDFQALIDTMNENTARERGNYHLTIGDLAKVLKAAPKDATFDSRIKGIGSWRGSYTEIALYTAQSGYYVEHGDYQNEVMGHQYDKEFKEESKVLPTNANELGELLESFIGKDFIGYKGGNFTIEDYKPLWVEVDGSTYSSVAVIGIDENLKLITKDLEDDASDSQGNTTE